MKEHSLLRGRVWMPLAIAVALVAGHGIIIHFFSSHLALSAAVVFAAVVGVAIKHVGLYLSLRTMKRVNGLKPPDEN